MLAMTTEGLFWDIFIGLVGMGFFIYGKKRPDPVSLITGIILMVYPYAISSLAWDIGIGVGIVAIYIFLKRVVRI